ncbi:MAG: PD-(D/E)XK nuclease family protein [Epsilonproteobacteria bacterium]|nr:PD-(D/E)XK nuclease family protein [Campylobacterota bacterium]
MNLLRVFPTNRSIKDSFSSQKNSFLTKSVTIDEFEKKAVRVKGKKEIDKDKRVLLLKEAADFKNFSKLKIKNDYLSFLKSSDFLLGFFDELALEKVDIEHINTKDTYAEYEEHLAILKELFEKYKSLLEKNEYYDRAILTKLYEINEAYIKRFDKIELYLDGYLSNFEMELFLKIAKIKKFYILFDATKFNKKMQDRFKESGIELKSGFRYLIDLSEKRVIEKEPFETAIKNIEIFFVNNKIEQIAYIKKKIYDFIKDGIKPENIVVILPDESFSSVLKDFDSENIFNFAMGFPFEESFLYSLVDAIYGYIDDANLENLYRMKRYFDDGFEEMKGTLSSLKSFDELLMFLENLADTRSVEFEERTIFKEELFKFERLKEVVSKYSLKEMLYLFLSRLKERKIDDNRGGKVTVMGVLESRLVAYEGVIVVDFNEDTVPKKSQKELFLSSSVRKKAGLPTSKDRENLQKYYYHKLLLRCKRGAICAVKSDTLKPSRFLDELHILDAKHENFSHKDIFGILTKKSSPPKRSKMGDIVLEYDFFKVDISATSLKTYLECKRKYYLKYIKKIGEFEIPSSKPDDRYIGIKLHEYLKKLYEKRDYFEDEKSLLYALKAVFEEDKKINTALKVQLDIWLDMLEGFAKNEIERFKQGYKVLYKEKSLRGVFEGFNIVGTVDRIDKKGDFLSLLDYKSGNINLATARTLEKSVDFQMEFYYLLSQDLGKANEIAFYDLKKGKIIEETLLHEKLEILKERFKELKEPRQNFSECEDMKACRYCPYVIVCGRDEDV